jgi:hypothetical protein
MVSISYFGFGAVLGLASAPVFLATSALLELEGELKPFLANFGTRMRAIWSR